VSAGGVTTAQTSATMRRVTTKKAKSARTPDPAPKKKRRSGPSGPSGKNLQPRYTLRDENLPKWQAKAAREGKTFADWIRERLNAD
jgi:hypothetical protein